MNSLEAIIFILHYSIFLITVVLFFLKFHKKAKAKYIIYLTAALWIVFGTIDFILGVGRLIEFFKN
ncbi:MAG: hypothetical protein FWG70_01875 [Oscillospiraceae bacterium]|nr:hypothetical protein [Oscillospiraceae bacterium]